jgi:hypothetical protein
LSGSGPRFGAAATLMVGGRTATAFRAVSAQPAAQRQHTRTTARFLILEFFVNILTKTL